MTEIDIFEYYKEREKNRKREAEKIHQKFADNARSVVDVLSSVINEYTGKLMNEENLSSMEHDLISRGMSEQTAQYIVDEIHRQGSGRWDGNITLTREQLTAPSPFYYYDPTHSYLVPDSSHTRWIVN